MNNNTSDIFITSALPYVNNELHLGNFAGSLLPGDIISRYNKMIGNNTCYVCGTDDYGTATMTKSKKLNIDPEKLCDAYREQHTTICKWFDIEFDVWGQTSTSTQTEFVHAIFNNLYINGFIEKRTLDQLYCTKCNFYLADRYINGQCYHDTCSGSNCIARGDQCDTCGNLIDPLKLVNPVCVLCNSNMLTVKSSTHLFLLLDKLEKYVSEYVESSTFDKQVMAISKAWLNAGLKPRCITRDIIWGTPIPYDTWPELIDLKNKTFYVWFDAPIAYYSIYAHARNNWSVYLSNPDLKWISTQGKDNIPFHTIMFSATMIGSAATNNDNSSYAKMSKLKLPMISEIANSHYLMFEGKKFSKTDGYGIFSKQIMSVSAELNICCDSWRYYLMYIRPEGSDTNFNIKEFTQVVKSDLIDNFGNLVNRCTSIITKSAIDSFSIIPDPDILRTFINYENEYKGYMSKYKFIKTLRLCMKISTEANKYIQNTKPWLLINNEILIKPIIGNIVYQLICITKLLYPFIHSTCSKILDAFDTHNETNVRLIRQIPLLFNKIDYNKFTECLARHKLSN